MSVLLAFTGRTANSDAQVSWARRERAVRVTACVPQPVSRAAHSHRLPGASDHGALLGPPPQVRPRPSAAAAFQASPGKTAPAIRPASRAVRETAPAMGRAATADAPARSVTSAATAPLSSDSTQCDQRVAATLHAQPPHDDRPCCSSPLLPLPITPCPRPAGARSTPRSSG